MSYKIETIRTFDKQIKRLIKKHSSIKKDLLELVNDLMANPQKGTPLGKN
jgi:mRNA-degrading endonuclease RelE of RelBE toxin-antitoxin system